MEPYTTYKVPREPSPELFRPPPYCRKAEKRQKDLSQESPPTSPPRAGASLVVSNSAKVLHLLESLTDNCSDDIELMHEAECDLVFLINLLPICEEAVVKAVGRKKLEERIRVPISEETMKGLIRYEEQVLKIADDLDPEVLGLMVAVTSLLEDHKELLVAVPILSTRQSRYSCDSATLKPVLLACYVGSPKSESYLVRLANETFRFALALLLNTAEAEEEVRQKGQCQSLLGVARRLFSHLDNVNDLLKEIMQEARTLTSAERCSLFLLDPDHVHLVAKVFDGAVSGEVNEEVKIAKDQGIAGHVATTGKLLNIKKPYDHPLFYKGMDEATGFKTRNILCFPIRDEKGIVGVAQLCNKIGGNFDYFDEEVAMAFSIYCGLSIMHCLVYKEIQDAQARSKLSNELMLYHMKVSPDDIRQRIHCPNYHTMPDYNTFSFSPRLVIRREMVCFILTMFEDLGFMAEFGIKKETLAKFIMFIEKGYRDVPYHNWAHAFSVAHFGYLCLKNFQLVEEGYITQLEAMAVIIACLCHDIDHRGTNNSFQKHSNSVLASLYSSEGSVMERHHLAQTICTLNTEGCNFLECLNKNDYTICLDLIKDMILATDLATHFKLYKMQYDMVQAGYNGMKAEHRYAFVCLLMTCADLSDQTKDWKVVKKAAEKIFTEFFQQGDLERKLGKEPLEMMDRNKAKIPEIQIEFLKQVCLPVYKLLVHLFPKHREIVDSVKRNILCWESSKCLFEHAAEEGKSFTEVLQSERLEKEVEGIMEGLEQAEDKTT